MVRLEDVSTYCEEALRIIFFRGDQRRKRFLQRATGVRPTSETLSRVPIGLNEAMKLRTHWPEGPAKARPSVP